MSEVNKGLVAQRFGRHAGTYEAVTPVQDGMRRRLLEELPHHLAGREPRQILELGCGTGQLTASLHARYPGAAITAVDIAPEMTRITMHKCPSAQVVTADAEYFLTQAATRFDLIISSAAWQWFHYPGDALARCRARLNHQGLLAVATFGPQTFRELRTAFQHAYLSEGRSPQRHVLDMPEVAWWQEQLPTAVIEDELIRQPYAGVRDFLQRVQHTGATHSVGGHHRLSRTILHRMTEYYEQHFANPDGTGVIASYHLVFIYQSAG